MDHDRLALIRSCYDIDPIDYRRGGRSLLIGSGSGLSMGLMDAVTDFNFLLDVDNYRNRQHVIDWETIGVLLDHIGFKLIAMAGWFTIDSPDVFKKLQKGIKKTPVLLYEGGKETSLELFIQKVNAYVK